MATFFGYFVAWGAGYDTHGHVFWLFRGLGCRFWYPWPRFLAILWLGVQVMTPMATFLAFFVAWGAFSSTYGHT